jgi:probable F420-dependent oxidoreductase
MTDHRFRFGVVAGLARNAQAWAATAARAEELGYRTLLVPDTLGTLSPFSALAAAAATTRTLRLGTYVLSAANRTPGMVAWETASLDLLSGGRFELGLGGGRPGAESDAARIGVDFGSPSQRLQRVADTIRAVKQADATPLRSVQQPHPPILVAASQPRMLRLAAEQADIVALGLRPDTTYNGLAGMVGQLRTFAGDRFDALELHLNLAAVAGSPDGIPDWVSRMVDGDPRQMAAAGGIAFLTGTPTQMIDTLRRRRDELAISYIAVSAMFMEALAPIAEQLSGT